MIDHGSLQPDRPRRMTFADRLRAHGVMLGILTMALALAIGFFYVASEKREDARSDAVVGAADSVDNVARDIGDAAQNAADRLRKGG